MSPLTRRQLLAGLAGTAAAVAVGGCATVPLSGAPVDHTQVAEPGDQANPAQPAPGLSPAEVVRGFVNANARIDQDPQLATAAAYLTPAAQQTWQSSSHQVMTLVGPPRIDLTDQPNTIEISGSTDGYLRVDGSWVTTPRSPYTVSVTVSQVEGEWRVDTPPPALIITASDFNLAYTQRQVYFLNATQTLVVPDRRWLPNRSQYPATMATDLVDRLIAGPSQPLAPAVVSLLTSARRRAPIVANADAGTLLIDLTGITPAEGTTAAIAAQVVYTLRADAANIRLLVDGVPLDSNRSIWTTSTVGTFDPDVLPGSDSTAVQGYYLTAVGALHTLRDDQPVWGTAGTGELHAVMAAMSASGDVAIVGQSGDATQTMYLGSPRDQQPMNERLSAETFTSPSFTRGGDEVWTVTTGDVPEVVRLLAAGGRYSVDSASLKTYGPVVDLSISPDGVHVAVVVADRVFLVAAVYTPGASSASGAGNSGAVATLTAPTLLRNDLSVSRVVWADSQNLLLAAQDTNSTYRTVWRIGLDGRQRSALSGRGIVADTAAMATTPSLPMLISSGGLIYQLEGDDSSGEWTPVQVGGETLAGPWPLYPG